MGVDPGFSVGVVVVEGRRLLWATVFRSLPPKDIDDHWARNKALGLLAEQLLDVFGRWDDGDGVAVGYEAFNIPQTWQRLNVKGRKGRPMSKVSLTEGMWIRAQVDAISVVFGASCPVSPASHTGRTYPPQLREGGWPAAWVNADPHDSLRDAQSAFRVALAVPNRTTTRRAA
jgi:hypothetical protein